MPIHVSSSKNFKHVNYLWNDAEARTLENDEVSLLLYRSNLLGSDLRLTNYGGGNTSCKTMQKDPLTGNDTEVMWVKGSGGDLGTLKKSGLSALYMDRLQALKRIYRGLEYEDDMVELYNHCIYDLDSKSPSIDTPLHAFLPFNHIDHLHPDAAIAIAAAKDGEQITKELFGGTIGWVGWQRPGFDLGLKLNECINKNPNIKGIMLGSHGLFTWGDTAYESYLNTLEVIERCAEFIEDQEGKKRSVFGREKIQPLIKEQRLSQAATLAPLLRGYCSSETSMVGHFSDDISVLQFINSEALQRLAPIGTSCPDHFLRTKISPLVLDLAPDEDLSDSKKVHDKIFPLFEAYRNMYIEYYDSCRNSSSPAMRDPNPVIILYPGVGMFSFAKDKQTARVASEFYINAVNVMRGAEALSEYTALPRQEAFNIEYWLLEEAKLKRLPKAKPLSGKIALITGSGGGIGKAIAEKFVNEGACVILTDINRERLNDACDDFKSKFGTDVFSSSVMDVTREKEIIQSFKEAVLAFGGVDIVVNNAGISISKTLLETTLADWNLLQDILVKAQFIVSKAAVEIFRKQDKGGDIINIVSKNALVSGPNNTGYGTAKGAQLHMSRLMAAELGVDNIRVNIINPDAVIKGSNIWAGGWADGRAKAYGITVDELPAYYASRTLLNKFILPEDIANAAFLLVGGLMSKSTGNVLNVDGGIAAAFVR